jgi:hypothetical protein
MLTPAIVPIVLTPGYVAFLAPMRVNRKSAIQVTTSATPADIDTIASGSISNSGKAVGAVNVCPGEMEQKRKTCHALTVTGYNPGRKAAIFACKYLSDRRRRLTAS